MGKIHIVMAVLFVIGGGTLLVVVGVAAMDEFSRSQKIEAEIQQLRDEATLIAQENQELQRNIEYFKTQAYKERQAKEKLDYKKPGEHAIVVSGLEESGVGSGEEHASELNQKNLPNYVKWWQQFFPHTVN